MRADENEHFTYIAANDERFKPIMQREQAWYVVGETMMMMKKQLRHKKKFEGVIKIERK